MSEIASKYHGWSLVSDEVCLDKTCVVCRKGMPKLPWKCTSFREIIGASLLSHLLPQKQPWWQACFVSVVSTRVGRVNLTQTT